MKTFLKAVALATVSVAGMAAVSVPAVAQSKLGVAVVDMDEAVNKSVAATNARTQMQTTYKANIDNFNSRKTALDADLKQKAEAFQAAVKAAGGKSTPALQTQYEQLQQSQQAAQAELQRIGQPIALANAYIEEQIGAKIGDALKAAMTKSKVDLVLQPGATVSYQPSVDITAAVTTELNTLVPSVNIVPPAGWQPGGQQQQQPASGAGR
ncbi:hypothetical protein GCM10007897_10650 [Sphingobium jiangsuense]|uniref:Skp family chaperone for outer membrane proteins n=1 Tax=Sphingobium jiangsuense TaxID=870476 RepID=A0A7W6BG10_9SPHN|nr:OmpH family outer membrane protein [Sphingobium jiangsuense]MBB3926300.1 Skp family chaperone for outer membrane proteins [Sphingobium jiangsuense]GLS99682.1 hypothetical protein GCM10007897_10650 [Sphingobium jiangsuense]